MKIGILDANKDYCKALCELIMDLHYHATPLHSMENLTKYLKNNISRAVILDIDTMGLKNQDIRNLSRKYKNVTFLCMSESRFHPDFKEVIGNHIFACLNKPIDPEELGYFLESIDKSRIR